MNFGMVTDEAAGFLIMDEALEQGINLFDTADVHGGPQSPDMEQGYGAARLVVMPEADGFLMYVHEENRSWVTPRLELVEAWLTANEARFAGLTPLQEECRRALGQDPDHEQGPD